jgi:aminomethyltransferase
MPVGTPFHERTLALCESLNYREWSGYYTVSAYETHHEHEYHAIRDAAALIDISPLYKYVISGRDALSLVDRVVTRDLRATVPGQVVYTTWCDEQGKVIDDGTVTRLSEDAVRLTAADPTLRWLHQNAGGLRVEIEDVSERLAALALQGPMSARLLRAVADAEVDTLPYFRMTRGRIAGVPLEISRTGYTGDLGYEIWIPADAALAVWDALASAGLAFGLKAAGMLALDIARVEAGLLLIDVDFHSSRKAMIASQMYTPFELGLGRLVSLDKPFVGRDALAGQREPARRVVGLEVDWSEVEALHEAVGLVPLAPASASRAAVPVRKGTRQIGRATTTAWSPTLKRLIALATVDAPHFAPGTRVEFEMTVDAVRHFVGATVVRTPFFSPARKTAVPPP